MRAFGFREHGGPERLEYVEVPDPEPGPGEVRVAVRAAAFNRLDRFTLAGIPGVEVARPHALGSDGAGTVERIGAGVTGVALGADVLLNPGIWDGSCDACRAGDEALCRDYRIVGEHTQGTAAGHVVVPARNLHRLPDGWTFDQGAAAPLVFQTAWRALATVAAVRPGERVAIVGAGGGVAPAATQVARLLGGTVAVVSRSAAKAEAAARFGATAALSIDDAHPLDRVLWEWSGKRGVDVIFDAVGAPTLPRSLRAVARGGRVVVIGASAGPKAEVDLRTLFWRQASVRGSTMASRAEFDAVLAHLAAGRLTPVVDSTFGFDDGRSAFERLASDEVIGKVVLRGPGTP